MSPDRKTAAVGAAMDQKLSRVRDVLLVPLESATLTGMRTNYLGAYFKQLALNSADGWLATQSRDSNVLHLWNLSVGADELVPSVVWGSTYFAFSPDGQWLANCWMGKFQFYSVGSWEKPVLVIPRLSDSDQHAPMAFSRDGRTVALAASRYIVQLYKLPKSNRDGAEWIATLESPDRFPLEFRAFSPDSRHRAASTDGPFLLLWNLAALGEGLESLGLRRDWPGAP